MVPSGAQAQTGSPQPANATGVREAEQALQEGRKLLATPTVESRRLAIARLQQAVRLFEAAGDQSHRLDALGSLGEVYNRLGESHQAIDVYATLIGLARNIGNRAAEAVALQNIGLEYSNLGEYPKALQYLEESLKAKRALGKDNESPQMNSLALTYYRVGDSQKALDYYGQALEIRRRIGDKNGQAFTLAGIGATVLLRDEYQHAIDLFQQALALWSELNDPQQQALALNNIGAVYTRLGDERLALEYYERALPLRQSTGNRPGEAATRLNLCHAELALGESQKALQFCGESLAIYKALGNHVGEAGAVASVGDVYLKQGRWDEALERYLEAKPLAQSAGDRTQVARAGVSISRVHFHNAKFRDAAAAAEEALAAAREGDARQEEQSALTALAKAEAALGRLERARAHIEAAVQLAESVRGSVAGSDLRASYLAAVRPEYELLVDILMRQHKNNPSGGYDAEALAASERARARSLLDSLGESRLDIRQGVDPELLERERSLRATLRVRAQAPEPEAQELLAEYRELENQIRARSPRYASLMQPEPISAAGIRDRILDDETAILEYALGEERSYVWALTREGLISAELPARAAVEAAARKAYRELSASGAPESSEPVRALSRMIVGPVSADLNKKRLVVVAEGALQYIPFGALPEASGQPLIARHEIVGLPSVSTLWLLRRDASGRQPAAKRLIVIGDPVFDAADSRVSRSAQTHLRREPDQMERSASESGMGHFERLWSTRLEADSIVALAGKAEARKAVDFDASSQLATSGALTDYRIVHIATHALLNNRHPELSGLVFSLVDPAGRPIDGFLRAYEVYNLRLQADLVVLSACQTALGEDVRGEGLMGMTRGFMYAGAPRVVASLWRVPDRGTAELMKRFYEGMLVKGLRPSAALRAAQLAMRKDPRWRAPYNWAGFTLQGEWN